MSNEKGARMNPETGHYEYPNALGVLPSGLTPKQHDEAKKAKAREDRVKKTRAASETLGVGVEIGQEQNVAEKLAPNRAEADAKRPPRQPMDIGARIHIPQYICDEIEQEGCVRRLCLDTEDRLERYLENWWEFHLDANGNQIERRSGNGNRLVLMKLPKHLFEADKKLQSKARAAKYNNSNLLKAGYDAPNGSVLREDSV